jgi:para-aminobenzoate synthetase component 1
MRNTLSVSPADFSIPNILEWGRNFDHFVLLNSNKDSQFQNDSYSVYDWLVAAGSVELLPEDLNLFPALKDFHSDNADWIFGYMSYDIKNQLENLSSDNPDRTHAPSYRFFRPEFVITCVNGAISIHYLEGNESQARMAIDNIRKSRFRYSDKNSEEIIANVSREKYISTFEKIRRHIQLGNIYEMNYCVEFFSEDALIDPPSVYQRLNEVSPMPFSAFVHTDEFYVMCASPERYLAKRNNKIISQPIKGTAKRNQDPATDQQIRTQLSTDPKERSENVMIVDMVRNDLSRTAAKGSVKVEELFGIKTFRLLHQMVSTVVSEVKPVVHFTDVIAKSFPMGSMTGAPKINAMKLIDEFEDSKRAIFSGSIGYITPDGDFDLNVVIRSIVYNANDKYLSYMAGSAITINATAEKEYEEVLLKAASMKQVLTEKKQHAG